MQADKKKKESMSMWKIILIVNLAVYILSFVIPSGAYQRDGKMAVPGTYEVVEKTYLNPVDVILAVGDTVYSSFGKLFVTLIIMGGMMGIVNSTGVLDRALGNLIHRLKDKALAIIPIYVFATALLGCVGSMISTVILFVPLGLLIAQKAPGRPDLCRWPCDPGLLHRLHVLPHQSPYWRYGTGDRRTGSLFRRRSPDHRNDPQCGGGFRIPGMVGKALPEKYSHIRGGFRRRGGRGERRI